MLYFFEGTEGAGNPSSVHWAGRKAKVAVDEAREHIQRAFDFDSPEEFIFTGSGTESINTAIKGAFFQALKEKRDFHLITSEAEHEATAQSAQFVERLGAKVHWLGVNENCELDLGQLDSILKSVASGDGGGPVVLVSLLAINNEIGVLTPIQEVAKLCQEYGALFHIDAVQGPGKMPGTHGNGRLGFFSVKESGADMVSFSAHKIGGPKGVGGLYLKRGIILEALLSGGAQERKRRAGTLNVSGIVGFGEAARILHEVDFAEVKRLRDKLEAGIKENIDDIIIAGEKAERAINVIGVIFPGLRGDSILMAMDLEGVCISAGSACNSGTMNPSKVLLAMGFSKEDAGAGIRISLGPENTEEEIDYVIETLPSLIQRIRAAKRD